MALERESSSSSASQESKHGDRSPHDQHVSGRQPDRRIRRLLICAAFVIAFILLHQFDPTLMRWRFLAFPEGFSGGLQQIIFGLRDFGQIVPITVAGVIVILSDRRWRSFILALLLAEVLSLAMTHPTKWCLSRYRPYPAMKELVEPRSAPDQPKDEASLLARLESRETWIRGTWDRWPPRSAYGSFPSGHASGAFAFAAVLVCFYPRLRWVFWSLAIGCAASRVLDAVHWPSDCLAGAAIGYLAGWLALQIQIRVLPVPDLPKDELS